MKAVVALQLCLVVVVGIVVSGCKATRSAYETTPYKVVRTEGKFQVRDYPRLKVAQTPIDPAKGGTESSFHRLHNFVIGQNQDGRKMPIMTPVFVSGGERNGTVALVVSTKAGTNEISEPSNQAVALREVPAGRFAVLQFSGGRSSKNKREALQMLRQWMARRGLTPVSSPVYAYFDPPWMPGFLRQNEVMMRTQPGQPPILASQKP